MIRSVPSHSMDVVEATGPRMLRVDVLGTVFLLQAQDAKVADALATQWSRCLVPDDQLHAEAGIVVEVNSDEEPLPDTFGYGLASQLTGRAITELSGHALMFHAAGLSDETGRVVALVAPSGSGKTTAARMLGGAGWGYVTDETVAVVEGGRVLPYPKPLSVVIDPTRPGHKSQHGPDELDLGSSGNDLSLARIVILDRVRDAVAPAVLTWASMMDGILNLIPQMSALPSLPRPLQQLCELVARRGIARLTYSDAATTGAVLRGLLAATVPAQDWAPLPTHPLPPEGELTYTQAPALDAVLIGEEALLLVDRTPVRLSPLGLTLWDRCATGATEPELVEAAVLAHGPHPQAAELIRQILGEMVDAGVLALPDVNQRGST